MGSPPPAEAGLVLLASCWALETTERPAQGDGPGVPAKQCASGLRATQPPLPPRGSGAGPWVLLAWTWNLKALPLFRAVKHKEQQTN